MYSKSKLGSAKAQLRIVSQSYGDMVRTFLFQVLLLLIHLPPLPVDLLQRRVSAVPQLPTGLQPALQEEGQQTVQAPDFQPPETEHVRPQSWARLHGQLYHQHGVVEDIL